jgi:hypothetical protein
MLTWKELIELLHTKTVTFTNKEYLQSNIICSGVMDYHLCDELLARMVLCNG